MKCTRTTIAAGSVLLGTLAITPAMATSANPFVATSLPSGYMLADAKGMPEKSSEEAKCGANTAKPMPEAKGSTDTEKAKQVQEAKCGADSNSKKL